jgi:homocysteine S-methyltransferase
MMADVQLRRRVLVLDGGLGSTLEEEYDVEFSASTPLWSSHLLLSSPATLLDLQTAFVTSGADVLSTATYQASFEGFRRTPRNALGDSSADARDGYDDEEGAAFMRSAVAIARSAFRATGRHGLVALSLGAFGACMIPSQEYTGKYPQAMQSTISLRDFHLDRLMCFAIDPTTWDDIDLVAFETLPRLTEVQATRLAMEELSERGHKPKPFWISCVFPNEDDNLPDDSSVRQVLHAMLVS